MDRLSIRLATPRDLPAINAIYNYYVIRSTCTYQLEPETDEGRRAWFDSHGAQHPITVAEVDGQVVGWGSLSRYRTRAAYDRTVENSVYVRNDLQRRGIGAKLLKDLIERGRGAGHHTIVAIIDGEQSGSIQLHGKHGFLKVGHLKQLGYKFGRWLDVVYMQLML